MLTSDLDPPDLPLLLRFAEVDESLYSGFDRDSIDELEYFFCSLATTQFLRSCFKVLASVDLLVNTALNQHFWLTTYTRHLPSGGIMNSALILKSHNEMLVFKNALSLKKLVGII